MSDAPKLYIAGMGMITPVGANTAMTAAAVRAGVSAYQISNNYYGQNDEPITMASVPNIIFDEIDAEITGGNRHNDRHDRVIKMAILAIREACAKCTVQHPIPLLLALPEGQADTEGLSPYAKNLEDNCKPWVSLDQYRAIHSGRAAGKEAIDFAFQYLVNSANDYILIGGSDSYTDYSRLGPLSKKDRLLTSSNMDGFAPGEGAAFLLLTPNTKLAMVRNGHMIAINAPGIATETGHLESDEPYRGDGLDQAFKKALVNHAEANIHSIFSSMNGENFWAKEYGVAYLRNKSAFAEAVKTEHPADCYGDLGAATSPALIALACESLFQNPDAKTHLVYSSSDTSLRGAVVVEKLQAVGSPAIRSQNHGSR
jgi:3-oxoacyl-[acyl-carrier-protein] synthase I